MEEDEEPCRVIGVMYKLIRLAPSCESTSGHNNKFWFCHQLMPLCDSVAHLGNILHYNLSDKPDIQSKQ